MSEAWVNNYVGIPFAERGRTHEGTDCWGLIWLAMRDEFAIDVPSYDDAYFSTLDGETIKGIMEREAVSWHDVPLGTEETGDVISFAINGKFRHVGLVVKRGLMLHCERGKDSVLEDYTRPGWLHRIRGIYRHDKLMEWTTTPNPKWVSVKVNDGN
jgi:cell wall-associated NlpC family hydrolase